MKEDRLPEDIVKFESSLREADRIPHPFLTKADLVTETKITRTRSSSPVPQSRNNDEELTLEEQKRREFEERAKQDDSLKNQYRVPEWWLGEEGAYKSSKKAQMGVTGLPKFG